jgi:3-oxoacyl-[acyl-carrier-protein] synthase-3
MDPVYITGTGSFLPNEPISNERIEQVLGFINDKASRVRHRVLQSNAIKTRHFAIDPETGERTHTNVEMSKAAVEDLLAKTDFDLADLQVLACGTSTPDQMQPNHGVMLHGELGTGPLEVVATAGVCCSGVTALKNAFMNVGSGLSENAIATGSELSSGLTHSRHFVPEIDVKLQDVESNPTIAFSQDFLRWMLSDGAGAMLLQPQPAARGLSLRIDWMEIVSFANEVEACMYWGATKRPDGSLQGWMASDAPDDRVKQGYFNITQDIKLLNGQVMEYTVGKTLQRIQEKRGFNASTVDWFLPHYSSHYFRSSVRDVLIDIGMEIPEEKWFTNLYERGNTGAASIFIMIDEFLHSDRPKRGDTILCYVPESSRFSSSMFHLTVVDAQG